MEQWTGLSVQLFTRHQPADDAPHSPEQVMMLQLNKSVDSALSHWGTRLAGENGKSITVRPQLSMVNCPLAPPGVATGFIHLTTPLETWLVLTAVVAGV